MASVSKRQWTYNGVKKEAWVIRYFDEKGVRRSKQFDQKKSADAFRKKVEREMEDGTHVADADAATVAEVAHRYMLHAEQRARDGRLGNTRLYWMRVAFDLHILPQIGERRMCDLQPGDTEALYRAILEARKVSPATARQIVQAMVTMESYACRIGAAKRSPLKLGAVDLRGIKANPIKVMGKEDAVKLLRHVLMPRFGIRRRNAAMTACMIHLAACCGLRSGEIRALTLSCVDLEKLEIRVRRNLTKYDEVKGPKTAAGNRNVPLPSHLANMLQQWLSDHHTLNPLGLLFTSLHNGPVRATDLHKSWTGVLRECGMDEDGDSYHFHALRHFAASWWIENAIPLPEVATLMGHSKVDMTLSIYAHALVRPQARAAAMDRMAAVLTQSPASADATATHHNLAYC